MPDDEEVVQCGFHEVFATILRRLRFSAHFVVDPNALIT